MLRLNFNSPLFEISAGQTFLSGWPDVARGPPIEEPCFKVCKAKKKTDVNLLRTQVDSELLEAYISPLGSLCPWKYIIYKNSFLSIFIKRMSLGWVECHVTLYAEIKSQDFRHERDIGIFPSDQCYPHFHIVFILFILILHAELRDGNRPCSQSDRK